MRAKSAVSLTAILLIAGQAAAQARQPTFAPGDMIADNLPSGGCPTYDGIIAVMVAMGQTGRAREVMTKNDCLPFSPAMQVRVEQVLPNNILKITTPDFPGSPPMFVSGVGFKKVAIANTRAAAVPALPQTPAWFSEDKANRSMAFLNLYQDVPPAADCALQRTRVEKIICSNTNLRLAEVLNTRADIYATENGTKRELDHRRFKGKLPASCSTESCVFESFRKTTNDYLGGESPYPDK